MIRTIEATGKTVEEARAFACAKLGVSGDELNVSFEVLEMPRKALFGLKVTPAKVRMTVEEPDQEVVEKVQQPAPSAEEPKKPEPQAAAPVEAEPAEDISAPAQEVSVEAPQNEANDAEAPAHTQADENEVEVPLVIEENPKVKAAVDYLSDVIAHMGVQNVTFSAVQKGEATIIRMDGEKLGALIGRRGETMESLSYLASLVANRLEGDYIKLGLDVSGYRGKREQDLTVLAQRIGNKVRKTGRSFAMEPMNPYERRIIHSAIGKMEGVRSESKGEGRDRRVVIYSTDPNAQNNAGYSERRNSGRAGNRGSRNGGGSRTGNRGERRNNGGNRGGYRANRDRNDRSESRGPRPSSVPERSYVTRDAEEAAPVAPKRTERVDDFADFSFGKIDL
jgi:spoIIIJ-associated protein